MSRTLAGFAALALMGAAALPLQANAAERHGATNTNQSVTLSAQRHYYRHRYWGPRYRYWGPRYGYYGDPYYGYPYRYYRPGPAIGFGIGPFGFGVY
ncbi:MAG: hypothetical protein JO000_05035 [Alphaproteobacteria bacterium]|nr:hypothetical protein [Alphaproteobacteria bacterium]